MSDGSSDWPAVAALNASRAVACWEYLTPHPDELRCAVLSVGAMGTWVDGMPMSAASATTVRTGSVEYVSVAALTASLALVCFADVSSSNRGRCNVLTVDDAGELVVVTNSGDNPADADHG